METTLTESQIREQLSMNIGTTGYYHHPLFKAINYTDGIKDLYQKCESLWLIIDILAIIKLCYLDHEFITIHLHKKKGEDSCYVTYHGYDGNELHKQEYPFTDFPLNDYTQNGNHYPALKLYYASRVLYLPSEH